MGETRSYNINFENIDVVSFLQELGLRNVEDRGHEVFYSCPFPGHSHEDKNPSASMQQGSTVAYCFGCGWRGNALMFLADYEGVSPITAAKWIRQRFGDDFKEPEGSFLTEIDAILEGVRQQENKPETVLSELEVDRRALDWMAAGEAYFYRGEEVPIPLVYMFKRGFSNWVLDLFDIGYDGISQRIAIPYRNFEGDLVGFKGRSFLKDHMPRYIVLGGPEYGFDPFSIGRHVFGLDKFDGGHLIVVEGELNTLSMYDKGFKFKVGGISGRTLSDKQVALIKQHADEVTFIFDDLKDSLAAALKLQPFMPSYLVGNHAYDPADATKEEINDLLAARKSPLELALGV